jgi:hypothetical protein
MKQAMIDYAQKPKFDHFNTPEYAIRPLLPYLRNTQGKPLSVWEPTDPEGRCCITQELRRTGHKVFPTGLPKLDFLTQETRARYDVIVANPPYSLKDKFIARAYDLGVPFALLLPLTALEGVDRGSLFRRYGIEVLVLDRHVEYTGNSVWFNTSWFCHGLLPEQLIFAELRKG